MYILYLLILAVCWRSSWTAVWWCWQTPPGSRSGSPRGSSHRSSMCSISSSSHSSLASSSSGPQSSPVHRSLPTTNPRSRLQVTTVIHKYNFIYRLKAFRRTRTGGKGKEDRSSFFETPWGCRWVYHSACDVESVRRHIYDYRTFSASERHRSLFGTKLYCLITEAAHVCVINLPSSLRDSEKIGKTKVRPFDGKSNVLTVTSAPHTADRLQHSL